MFLGGLTLALRPLKIVGNILLARLLDPEHFGTVALALVLLSTADLFVGFGMGSAFIHSKDDRQKVAFHAFLITMLSGVLTFAIFFTNAELLARFLGDQEIVPILRWLMPLMLFTALRVVPEASLQKDLLFGRYSLAILVSDMSYVLFALLFAVLNFGLWSLVFAQLASEFLRTLLAWAFNPRWDWIRPTAWDWPVMKGLLRYGGPSTSSGLVTYFHTHWDDWFVGRIFGTTSLGFYTKAYDLSNNTLSSLSRSMLNSVFLPSYAKMQDDPERMARVYVKSLRFVLLMMVPLALGMLVLAPQLVPVLLGDKWVPMILTLQIYAFMVLFRPISSNTSPLFMAVGRPGYMLRAGILLSVVMVPAALLLVNYGIEGIAIAVVISHIVGAAYNVRQVNGLLPGTGKASVVATGTYIAIGGVMAASVQLAKPFVLQIVGGEYNILALTLLVAVGAVIYGVLTLLLQRDLVLEIVRLVWTASGVDKRLGRFVPQRLGRFLQARERDKTPRYLS